MNRIEYYYYLLRYKALKAFWDSGTKMSRIRGIALMYHHISDEPKDIDSSCLHKVYEFENTLHRLKKEGYDFISVKQALDRINSYSEEKFAIVTFDDGFDNIYHTAYPILKKLDIPFAIFITTNFIDKPGYVTTSQLMELDKDQLCTVGAHTISHPMLRKAKNSKYEILQSKLILEKLLNHKIDYLAYPFGQQSSVSHKEMSYARNAGFKCAFGTIQSALSDRSTKNLFYLPRVVIKE